MRLLRVGERVETEDGMGTIIAVDTFSHRFPRYQVRIDPPDPYMGFHPYLDERLVRPVSKDEYKQLTLWN